MPSSHLILCHPLILLSPIPPSIRVFSNESILHKWWPKYCSFSFSISPSNEYSGMISFRIDLIWIYVSWFHTGLGRSLGVANGYPLQYSCLENSMDRGACRARVHVITKSRTSEWLSTTILVPKGSLGEYKLRSQSWNGIRSVSPELTLTCHQRLLWIPFPVAQMVKICLQCTRPGYEPWIGKIPWRREWQPTAVFLSGESHGQRSLAGHGPWGHQESEDWATDTFTFLFVNHWCHLGRKQWHPTAVLLPGKSHGRRSLMGSNPWGHEQSDTTEQLHFPFSLPCIWEGNGNPLQCSCLENPRDRGAWRAAVYGVAQSRTWLKRLSSSSSNVILDIALSCPKIQCERQHIKVLRT